MMTTKFTPLQIRRMERASRAARKEKKRIAKVSTHRSSYRWSSDARHELRVCNAKPSEKFSLTKALLELEDEKRAEEAMTLQEEQMRIDELEAVRRSKEQELACLLEESFSSKEFMEKFFEDVE